MSTIPPNDKNQPPKKPGQNPGQNPAPNPNAGQKPAANAPGQGQQGQPKPTVPGAKPGAGKPATPGEKPGASAGKPGATPAKKPVPAKSK